MLRKLFRQLWAKIGATRHRRPLMLLLTLKNVIKLGCCNQRLTHDHLLIIGMGAIFCMWFGIFPSVVGENVVQNFLQRCGHHWIMLKHLKQKQTKKNHGIAKHHTT